MARVTPHPGWAEVAEQAAGRLAQSGFAWWSIAWGVVWALLAVVIVAWPGDPSSWALAVSTLLSIASFLIGAAVLRRVERQREADESRLIRRVVFDLARRHGGVLTVGDVQANTRLTEDEIRSALRECLRSGAADVDSDERGVMVYLFREFMPPSLPEARPRLDADLATPPDESASGPRRPGRERERDPVPRG